MAFLRIFCLVFGAVAPRCWKFWMPSCCQPVNPLLTLLEMNSKHIRSIDAPGARGASKFDIRELKNTKIANAYKESGAGKLMPRTHPSKWKFFPLFRFGLQHLGPGESSVKVFVLTEGRGQGSVEGRLAGFFVLEETDGAFYLNVVEIDVFYQRRGLGKRLVEEAFSIAKKRNWSPIRLTNCVSCRDGGAWLYLSQARDAGFKFAHVADNPESPSVVLPLEGLHKTSVVYKENDWDSLLHFQFTMGRHPVYALSSTESVDGMHILKLDNFDAGAMRERWGFSCPPDWAHVVRLGRVQCFFAFEPDSTDILQGALLLKTGEEFTMELVYIPEPTVDDRTLRALLHSMFSDAQRHEKSVIFLKANTLSDWIPVDKKAREFKYLFDEPNSSHTWRRYQLTLS